MGALELVRGFDTFSSIFSTVPAKTTDFPLLSDSEMGAIVLIVGGCDTFPTLCMTVLSSTVVFP